MKKITCKNCRECWNIGAGAYKCGLLQGRVLVMLNGKPTKDHGWCMRRKPQQRLLRENKRKVKRDEQD